MSVPQTLNGLRAISVRLSFLWRGVWVAEVEVDADIVATAAAMFAKPLPALLTVGGIALKGCIDPLHSGVFGDKAHARIVGGITGGWLKNVFAQHFMNPGGVLVSTPIYAATAAEVLEPPPLDPIPQIFAEHFARASGPAGDVFGDRDWHVDPITGIVLVGPWLPLPQDPLGVISDFDISQNRVTIKSDNIIFPGTILIDPRFGAKKLIVRDVEQTFDKNGGSAEVWVADAPISRFRNTLKNLVNNLVRTQYLKTYRYRYVAPVADKMILQGITEGAPDLNPIEQWTGVSGIAASLAEVASLFPAAEVIVGFAGGSPTDPYIVSYSGLTKPLNLTLDAIATVNVGIPTSPAALSIGVLEALAIIQIEIAAIAAAIGAETPTWTKATATATLAPALAAAVTAATAELATSVPLITSKKLLSE